MTLSETWGNTDPQGVALVIPGSDSTSEVALSIPRTPQQPLTLPQPPSLGPASRRPYSEWQHASSQWQRTKPMGTRAGAEGGSSGNAHAPFLPTPFLPAPFPGRWTSWRCRLPSDSAGPTRGLQMPFGLSPPHNSHPHPNLLPAALQRGINPS